MKIIKNMLAVLVLLLAIAAAPGYWMVHQSLPLYQGQLTAAVEQQVVSGRDAQGYLSIRAQNRGDAAFALGFAHAQERYFQMDLLRRNSAGELAELFGAAALDFDKKQRMHRFRDRADSILQNLPKLQRDVLERYAAGANAGLQQLGMPPFEYLLLTQQPRPWQPADSLLVIYSMFLDLQGALGKDELAQGALKAAVPLEWYQFLTQHSSEWQAAIDGSEAKALPLPQSPLPALLKAIPAQACHGCGLTDSRDIGSNNFAVAANASKDGRAILADDMHLGIRVPGTWYKAQMSWTDGDTKHSIAGVTLPGTPAVVAGSNGHIAWGFTNSTADWHDVIALKLDDSGQKYQTPAGLQEFSYNNEVIKVKGEADVVLLVKETQWGPVMPAPFDKFALRWVGYDRESLNLNLLALEQAKSSADALALAPTIGVPAQNLLVADAKGQIGWTIIGAIPARQLQDWDTPQDWSEGKNYWSGYLTAKDYPQIYAPKDGRLWTANARSVGGDALALLGDGGYDLGARGKQIRDRLFALSQHDEKSLHAIQLDHEALFLKRWQQLLLEVLTPEFVAAQQLTQYRQWIETDSKAASQDAIGYSLLRAFRDKTLELMFAPLAGQLEAQQLRLRDLKMVPETPAWAMLQARRDDTLPGSFQSWDALLQQAVLDSVTQLKAQTEGDLSKARWGVLNSAEIQHPLTKALPFLGRWLNMPADPLAGDRHMPRVQLKVHGQSERMVVSPGHEADGILVIPAGQSGHPLSEFYAADHAYWLGEKPLGFLPQAEKYSLQLLPQR
ncbi:penicillin acylase family protein [Rheinheimera sp. F8]|uniref:penicillin acylase family protein n=1 Tax=Rheinheimera sp. F8 TaxID=1763998 RepID=UPI000744CB27|nr:penicillin acylase family protein [Rheinheimera sp. F8]ALZ74627.1 penicillin amidase [Rheinheimera sp. F8]